MLDVGLDRLRGMKGTRATDVMHDGLKAYFQSVSTSVGMLDIFPSLDVPSLVQGFCIIPETM